MKRFSIIVIMTVLMITVMTPDAFASNSDVVLEEHPDVLSCQNDSINSVEEGTGDMQDNPMAYPNAGDGDADYMYYDVTYTYLDGHKEELTIGEDWYELYYTPELNNALYYWEDADTGEEYGRFDPVTLNRDYHFIQRTKGNPDSDYTVTLLYDDGRIITKTVHWGDEYILPQDIPEGYWWTTSEEMLWGLEGGEKLYVTGDLEYCACNRQKDTVIVEQPNPMKDDLKTEPKTETKDIAAKDHSPKTGDEGITMPVFLLLISVGTLLLGSKHMRQVSK